MSDVEKTTIVHDEDTLNSNKEPLPDQIQLDPQPSGDPNDPFNWPSLEKNLVLLMVSCMAFNGAFDAASPAAGFNVQAKDFNVEVVSMLSSVGVQTIMLGVGGFLWVPLSHRYGRKPIYLLSAITATMGCLGCSLANSLGGFLAGRAINGLGCSGSMSLASLTVKDMFSPLERGRKMGTWTVFFGISPYIATLLDGFVTTYAGWRWMQWLTFFIWAFLTICCFFLPETLYHRHADNDQVVPVSRESYWQRLKFKRFRGHLTCRSFYQPLLMAWYPCIFFPSIYYGNIYGFSVFGSLGILPFAFGEDYGFDAVGQGLVTISLLVGTAIGEPMAGPFSDWVVSRQAARNGGVRYPELRLRAIWLGVVLLPISLVIIGCTIHYKTHFMGPCVGMGIAAFATQIISTVALTYEIDCYDYATGDVSLLFNLGRQISCFYVAFYIHHYTDRVGYAWAFGIYAIISIVLALPLVVLSLYGGKIRAKLGHDRRERIDARVE